MLFEGYNLNKSINLKNVNYAHMTVPVANSPVTASESSGTLSVNISIQKNNQMQFYLLNMSLLFLRIFDICFVRRVCNFLGSVSLQQKFKATDRPVL